MKKTFLNDFATNRNSQMMQNDGVNAMYFKVNGKTKQERETSLASLLLAMPENDTTTAKNGHYINMEQAKTYFNDLAPAMQAYNLELQIKNLNKAIYKTEAKYKCLLDEGATFDKKRVNIEKKSQENKQEQQTRLNEVENQKQKLAVLVSQRKS